MFSSLLRPSRGRHRRSRPDRSPFSSHRTATATSPIDTRRRNLARRQNLEADDDDFETEDEQEDGEMDGDGSGKIDNEHELAEEDEISSQEDGLDDETPLLPIFSSAHLDALPVFSMIHAIRFLVVSRCETVLSWEQLRSPQVSQFLLKPIQQEIRANHFNAATEHALMANCLQFHKEISLYPGNSGTSKTRAMLCELIAIKLLREYSTRELIDALSYDFDPLQGPVDASNTTQQRAGPVQHGQRKTPQWSVSRISCFEIAIRAQSKRFLAHPSVVQQLEAIWAGTIVFHAAADSMHRQSGVPKHARNYGTDGRAVTGKDPLERKDHLTVRRTVTLYNPKDASLFKLSRLRVPRYRNILSTMSFAILLSLFLAVLIQRSLEITPLEVVFWFWSAGYMLDEIVGFNEQGFSLYIASFWNTFDLGILLILFVHLCLRIYGIIMPDVRKHTTANLAYDVLAADAILLFPRLFSVLDHYRYFSQLLIAFRMMASDLMAVFVLILISCSGFFVALTLSFGNEGIDTPGSVAYALLQILMGFTPAAWDRWSGYNGLGKTILTLFLFICHFLVVTILITVLTNSFMAIVQNANDEHQFVFAVNTISNVKSDALFSYVAPTNILQWLLTPLRYFLPFRQYVRANRTMIKVTHFPILFSIYFYEKTILRSSVVDSIDVVENRGRPKKAYAPKLPRLAREPSIATFRQDLALEEVFRRPFDSTMRTTQQSQDRRKTSNVVNSWMNEIGEDYTLPPQEQDGSVVDRLERTRPPGRAPQSRSKIRQVSRAAFSVASDPEEFVSRTEFFSPELRPAFTEDITPSHAEGLPPPSEAVADNGVLSPSRQAEAREDTQKDDKDKSSSGQKPSQGQVERTESTAASIRAAFDYFGPRPSSKPLTPEAPSSPASLGSHHIAIEPPADGSPSHPISKRRPRHHARNVSSATMIYKPNADSGTEPSSQGESAPTLSKGRLTVPGSGAMTPASKQNSSAGGRRTPKRPAPHPPRIRPMMPARDNPAARSTPNLNAVIPGRKQTEEERRASLELDLVSDIGDNKAIGGGYVGALPASFATQMAYAAGGLRTSHQRKEEQEMFGRLMMARMNSLEEGFREVIHEMRENMRPDGPRSRSLERPPRPVPQEKRGREKGRFVQLAEVLERPAESDKENLDSSPPSRPSNTLGNESSTSV